MVEGNFNGYRSDKRGVSATEYAKYPSCEANDVA
jgi:hypothetical protein